MKAYIGRQPIFSGDCNVVGYELLYRDENNRNRAAIEDGNVATSRLLSDAITLFGLPKLTGNKPAFVNFTDKLIKNDFALLATPDEILVEILEDVDIDSKIEEKIMFLKEKGYKLALDDYVGSPVYDKVLPYVDIIKVDFMQTTTEQQNDFAVLLNEYPNITLLAEKVETEEEYNRALEKGYSLFQGYYFEKPQTIQKVLPKIPFSVFNKLMTLLAPGNEIDFDKIAKIIKSDALLTFKLMKKVQTLQYYRGNKIVDVKAALVTMGEAEVRRWLLLMLARNNNITRTEELPHKAFIRGYFAKKLVEECKLAADSELAFIIGMFSMLDKIIGRSMSEVLSEIKVPAEVYDTLMGIKESIYSKVLGCVCSYEEFDRKKSFKDYGIAISDETGLKIYMRSMIAAGEELK